MKTGELTTKNAKYLTTQQQVLTDSERVQVLENLNIVIPNYDNEVGVLSNQLAILAQRFTDLETRISFEPAPGSIPVADNNGRLNTKYFPDGYTSQTVFEAPTINLGNGQTISDDYVFTVGRVLTNNAGGSLANVDNLVVKVYGADSQLIQTNRFTLTTDGGTFTLNNLPSNETLVMTAVWVSNTPDDITREFSASYKIAADIVLGAPVISSISDLGNRVAAIASGFSTSVPAATHKATSWRLFDAIGNVLTESLGNTTQLLEYTFSTEFFPPLNDTVSVGVQFFDSDGNGSAETLKTYNVVRTASVAKPRLVSVQSVNRVSITVDGFATNVPNATHQSTTWALLDAAGNVIIETVRNVLSLNSYTFPYTFTSFTDCEVRVTFFDSAGNASEMLTVPVEVTVPVVVGAPEFTYIAGTSQVSVTVDGFSTNVPNATHASTTWRMTTLDGTELNNDVDSSSLTTYKFPHVFTAPYADSVYLYATFKDSAGNASPTTRASHSISIPAVVAKPVLTTSLDLRLTVNATGFATNVPGAVHASTDWVMKSTSGVVLQESLNNTVNKVSYEFPKAFTQNQTVVVEVVFRDSIGSVSEKSSVTVNVVVDTTIRTMGTLTDGSSFDNEYETKDPFVLWLIDMLETGSLKTLTMVDLAGLYRGGRDLSMGSFSQHVNLEYLDLQLVNTYGVTKMNSVFRGNTKLTTLNVTGFDVSNVTVYEETLGNRGTFSDCASLATLDLHTWDIRLDAKVGAMFKGCNNLGNVYVKTQAIADKLTTECYETTATFVVKT